MFKHIIKVIGLILFSCIALGSATNEERLANRQRVCASYGFQYGTDGMAQCVMQRSQQAEQANNKMMYCNATFGFGSPAYNRCMAR